MSSNSFGGGAPLEVGVASALMGLTTIVLALRAYTSFYIVGRTSWDLLWVFVAYLLGLLAHVFLVLSARNGIGNHLMDVDPAHLGSAFLYQWIFNVCAILSTGFGKLAILDILLHISGPSNQVRRWVLYFIGASTMLLNINQSVIIWFQCEPREKVWNVLLPGTCDTHHVALSLGIFQGSWSAACDFFLAFYPAILFWDLRVNWKTKLGLIALFAGGSVAGAAAAIKTSYILNLLASNDITYAILPLVLWASTEMWLILIMGSIPTLRSLFVKLIHSIKSYRKSWVNARSSVLNGGGVTLKETYNGSTQNQSDPNSKLDGSNRPSPDVMSSSESEEDIPPQGNGILVKYEYGVTHEERMSFSAETHQQAPGPITGPESV